jgi:hypothetical protein
MYLTRRFVFRGNAAALGGHIYRPKDFAIQVIGASSLPVTGGISHADIKGQAFGDSLRFGSATTHAEGVFDNAAQAIEMTKRHIPEDRLTTTTTVAAEVHDLVVGKKPQLVVKRLSAKLVGHSPKASGEPPIAVAKDTTVEGGSIDGFPFAVTLNLTPFTTYPTRSALVAAMDTPNFVDAHGASFFMSSALGAGGTGYGTGLIEGRGMMYATIVKEIHWTKDKHPTATIDHHTILVPGFGQIFFGEIFITDVSRRLTMMRLQLGSTDGIKVTSTEDASQRLTTTSPPPDSQDGGMVACSEVETNGSWYPPFA